MSNIPIDLSVKNELEKLGGGLPINGVILGYNIDLGPNIRSTILSGGYVIYNKNFNVGETNFVKMSMIPWDTQVKSELAGYIYDNFLHNCYPTVN